uniref:Uncharacterized protein n=1 Tax=Arundo donax TaxID=35708 RepID=A0A0A9G6X4_ARUDO
MGFSTAAGSTHNMCLYSSSPKSCVVFDFLSHGFHTTASGSPSFFMTNVLFFS